MSNTTIHRALVQPTNAGRSPTERRETQGNEYVPPGIPNITITEHGSNDQLIVPTIIDIRCFCLQRLVKGSLVQTNWRIDAWPGHRNIQAMLTDDVGLKANIGPLCEFFSGLGAERGSFWHVRFCPYSGEDRDAFDHPYFAVRFGRIHPAKLQRDNDRAVARLGLLARFKHWWTPEDPEYLPKDWMTDPWLAPEIATSIQNALDLRAGEYAADLWRTWITKDKIAKARVEVHLRLLGVPNVSFIESTQAGFKSRVMEVPKTRMLSMRDLEDLDRV